MGVRGLTTYIAQNAESYLDPFELHDCNLVIDGDSLSSNLYKWASNCNSAFGGNYDQYYRTVCNFYRMLKQCNVTPYVLLDGGYQPRKLRTVRERLRAKIGAVKYLNPFSCRPMFPIMMREVFVDATSACNIAIMRCIFEADDEVAVLARRLNCPVLSYDSDFYIHNVMYIPSITLTFKVYRRNEPKERRGRNKKVVVQEMLEDGSGLKVKQGGQEPSENSFYYMDCCVYTIQNLIRDRGLSDEMLPLFAILLGNDYIKSSMFNKFYANVSLKGVNKRNSRQYKRIAGVLRWLQNEKSLESAVTKILGRVEKDRREWMLQQMESAMGGYSREESKAFLFFGFEEDDVVENPRMLRDLIDENAVLSSDESEIEDEIESESEFEEHSNDEGTAQVSAEEEDNKSNAIDANYDPVFEEYTPPVWIQQRILEGKLPRFVIDLLYLKLYVNSPQVENFLFPDCNEIALPLLRLIFTMLHYPARPELRYLTRVQRVTNVHYKRLECLEEDIKFDPNNAKKFPLFEHCFRDFPNREEILRAVTDTLPKEYQLYALAIIYWAKYSKHVNLAHINSIILSLLVLSVIDERVEPIRAKDKYEKYYRAVLQNENAKPAEKPVKPTEESEIPKELLMDLHLNALTKSECILSQRNMLVHFEVNSKLRSKHTEFSSTILHAFAELQSIVYHLNVLNTLCDEPFENIRISSFYNGCFLYNIYVALKERPSIPYYIQHYLFPESQHLFGLYQSLIALLTPFVGCLSTEITSKRKNRNARKRKQRMLKRAMEEAEKPTKPVEPEQAESDFEDMNNKFACLLKV